MSNGCVERYLLLGGGGFLGSHLVEALRSEGRPVRVFDRAQRPAGDAHWCDADVEWFQGDFSNRNDVASAVDGCTVVFHLVGTTTPKTSNDNPVFDLESNLLPTIRFLDVAREQKVRRVVFASSGGTVYGVPRSAPIAETHPTQPICSYGIHKLAIEHYLHLYYVMSEIEYCVLRLANPFGERQRPDALQGVVSVFLDKALRGDEITIWGDGSVVRDFIYVRDAARAFCLAARYEAPTGVFNIGSGEGRSVNEIIAAIEQLIGRPALKCYVAGRRVDVPVNILDSGLASRTLGWAPQFAFLDGLQRTLDYLRRRQLTA